MRCSPRWSKWERRNAACHAVPQNLHLNRTARWFGGTLMFEEQQPGKSINCLPVENTLWFWREHQTGPLTLQGLEEKEKWKCQSLSPVRLYAIPWTVAHKAPLSMGFSREEYWSALPFPSPGIFLTPGIEPGSPALQADSLLSEPPGKP